METIHRRAKIVCTLGPASSSPEVIRALIRAGMNVARINFSHGEHADHERVIRTLRGVAAELGEPIAVLQDLQGPKMRTGTMRGGSVELADGQEVVITTRPVEGTPDRISSSYEPLARDVSPGDTILLDDGLIELRVLASDGEEVRCRVAYGGRLSDHKGINLPGVKISSPSLTPKDEEDLRFGLGMGVDYVALSFVRSPQDVRGLQEKIAAAGADVPVIAKLEKPEAMAHLDGILAAADGVMIARGDLGVEMPLEQVPGLQKRIIRKANARGVVVITATQMLESMRENPRPTRAEASDVANAVFDGSDALMLSGETAIGSFPVETVATMSRIIQEAEDIAAGERRKGERTPLRDVEVIPNAAANAACEAAEELGARALVAFTQSGFTARLVSKYHPVVPVLAFTPDPVVQRRLNLLWGVTPRQMEPVPSVEAMIRRVDEELLTGGLAHAGEIVVLVAGFPLGVGGRTDFVKFHRVGERP
jgi:pyruvate kinase